MPYRLSKKGQRLLEEANDDELLDLTLTPLEIDSLSYLYHHPQEGFVGSSTIAHFYGLAPQAMRGPCASLYRQGLIDKKED